ncbi:right-handed parallel beta-helix repeat-containing protein [Parvularcula sp. IMCC14364]|uniref:right-handed parallel beta-helix repeat-containing protein n=1 Tax=Parvularcula sp. IMCC14364 TaxID=3067902 RepID=UPI0027412439|nr:right-handed parallel beta-helix repeat-containing protein [Parvularcula sp. IMCC14364]
MRDTFISISAVGFVLVVMVGLIFTGLMTGAPAKTSQASAPGIVGADAEVRHPGSVVQLIEKANAGSVVKLPQGQHGSLKLNGLHFDEPVIVDGSSGSVFSRIILRDVRNLHFRNVTIEAGTTTDHIGDFAVTMMRSHGVRVESSHVSWSDDRNWANDGSGMTARLSSDVLIADTVFHNNFTGLVIRDADNITIQGNIFRDLRRDGINVSGTVNIVIDQNMCTDFHPVRPQDHPDCIQFWNDTAVRSNENIRITGNRILRGEGGVSQGIFLAGQKPGLPHRNILIENNHIHQAMGQGIFIRKADNAIIRGNIVRAAPPVEHTPVITVRSPVSDILIEGNRAARIDVASDVLEGAVTLRDNAHP